VQRGVALGATAAQSASLETGRAIEQLALGHHRAAQGAYLRLAQAQPERPAYGVIARILARKLRARCTARADADESACHAQAETP
jgi:hypothetical protein